MHYTYGHILRFVASDSGLLPAIYFRKITSNILPALLRIVNDYIIQIRNTKNNIKNVPVCYSFYFLITYGVH